jgi:hypothetical protein
MKTFVAIATIAALAVPAMAVSHAEETPVDMSADQFLLECVWTGDRHHNTACGGFPTLAVCEREGRTAVALGELSSFNCVSAPRVEWESHTVAPANSLGGGISGGISAKSMGRVWRADDAVAQHAGARPDGRIPALPAGSGDFPRGVRLGQLFAERPAFDQH